MAAEKEKEQFSENYLILKPRDGGILDMFHLLCSHNVQNNLVDASGEDEITEFKRRLIMVNSVLIQKALQFLDKPMARFGSLLEMWINLLNSNDNFAGLLCRLFKGRPVKIPERTSATFISALGNLDQRVALDKNIEIGDCRYTAELSVMASKIAYENEAFIKTTVENQWQMEFLGFYDFWNDYLERFSTQAFMLYDKRVDKIVVAFRGTSPYDAIDWSTDFDISWYELGSINCKVHGGFMKALGLPKNGRLWPKEINNVDVGNRQLAYYTIREKLKCLLRDSKSTKFIITGHSLGGALAILLPMVFLLHEETELLERLEGVYTFGQPRVGDERLGKFMDEKLSLYGVKYFRFVYCNDIVPRLPPDDSQTSSFKHFGTCVYYNSFYRGKIVKEEPNKNYLSLMWQIPKMLNAAWELIRSFIMVFWKGPDYAEGWSLRFLRLIGLVFPGVPAHSLQDYVNAIRLDSCCCSLVTQAPNSTKMGEFIIKVLVYAVYIYVFSIIFSRISIQIL